MRIGVTAGVIVCMADKVLWNNKIYRIERSVWKNYIAPLFSK
jgi:hypothetical protein